MQPDNKVQERIDRGRRAKELVDSEIFKEAISEAKAATYRSWSKTDRQESEQREWLYQQSLAFDAVVMVLRVWSESGKFELMEIAERAKRVRVSQDAGRRRAD